MMDHPPGTPITGTIGIYYLKEIWQDYIQLGRSSQSTPSIEWKYLNGVCNALGIGLEPTIQYLLQYSPSFTEFENWIKENGTVSADMIAHFNALFSNEKNDKFVIEEEILSASDLEFWNRNGYFVLKEAVPKADCDEALQLIYQQIDAVVDDPASWYRLHTLKQGIMVQLFNAPILDKNRLSKKINLAYQQLWQRSDLVVSMDRVSFNPPETANYKFPGPNLHWDVSLKTPIPFGLQGLLYLTDTAKDQGAFTLIPGFHHKIESWLEALDPNINPREEILSDWYEPKPIAAQAGDFIVWDQRLPHGSRPNTSTKPRVVQYINYQPLDLEYQMEWI